MRKLTKKAGYVGQNVKEDCQNRITTKTIQHSTMTAALKCLEAKMAWQREDNYTKVVI